MIELFKKLSSRQGLDYFGMARRHNWRKGAAGISLVLVVVMVIKFKVKPPTSLSQYSGTTAEIEEKPTQMNLRTLRMRQACSQYPVRRHLKAKISGKRLFYISEKHKLSYCRVAKVGSTFWTQVFLTLAGVTPNAGGTSHDAASMFHVPRHETHQSMKKYDDLQMNFNDRRVRNTTSFLVARNPYSRLFSSYIDQIYLPNKWEHAAKMVKDPKRQKCGNDVTFDEFLTSISDRMFTTGNMDLHWAPVFSICDPCKANIDILAKQETFNEDAQYILNLVGVEKSTRDKVAQAIGESLIEISIPTLVHTYITKGHNIRKGCIKESELAKKIWTAFQIQGYIHNNVIYPKHKFENVDDSELDEHFFTKTIIQAIKERPLTSEERNKQRQDWKVHFWKSIRVATLEKVQDAYYEDFFVFQYDLDPNTM